MATPRATRLLRSRRSGRWDRDAVLALLHAVALPVHPPVPILPGSAYDPERRRQESQRELAARSERLRGQGLSVETEQLEGVPANELAAYAHRHGIDLVVLADPGRSRRGYMLAGRIAEPVLQDASCPVLLVPRRD